MTAPWLRATRGTVVRALPLLLFAMLVTLAAAKVAAFGVCCADDGLFANTARNVAAGLGYGSTMAGTGFRPFDPLIGMGPTVILPAAAATALLGNRYWVPGAAAITLWALLLLAVHRGLRGRERVENLSLASGVFLVGLALLFPYHFEHWFALLGEVPAALLLALGAVLLARAELSARSVALAALSWGLAFLTKMVAAWFCAAFFAALATRILAERRGPRELFRLGLVAAGAFAAPGVAFEAWKVVSLGGLGPWRQHLTDTATFVRAQGAPALGAGRWARAHAYDQAFATRFGFPVWLILGVSLAAGAALLRRGHEVQRRMALPLTLGIAISCGWFLFRSIGWPRYLIVTLVLAWALVVLVLTTLRPRPAMALAAALVLALVAVNRDKLPALATGFENGLFSRSTELTSALELTAFVDARSGAVPFANQSWASTADLEYYARSVDVFRRYHAVDRRGGYYVVFNRRFRVADPELDRLVAECAPAERSFEPYAVLSCGNERR